MPSLSWVGRLGAALVGCSALLVTTVATASAAEPQAPAPAAAGGQSYYVDCSAAADGSGTERSPWNNLKTVASRSLKPGDKLLLRRGTECAGTLSFLGSGTPGSPIVVGGYGRGPAPRVAGRGTVPEAVRLNNQSYVHLTDLEVTNTGPTAANRRGVYVTVDDTGVARGLVVRGLNVHDVNGDDKKDVGGSAGILFDALGSTTPSYFDGITIAGNTVTRVDRSGINMSSQWRCRAVTGCKTTPNWTPFKNVRVNGNTVTDTGGDGLVIQNSDGAVVERNVVRKAAQRSNVNNAALWAWNSDNTLFQYNEVSGTRRAPGSNDGMAFDVDYGTNNTVYQYNYSHGNEGGMAMWCGCGGQATNGIFRYNISENDGDRILMTAGAQGTGNAFYNNTVFIGPGSDTKIIDEYSTDTRVTISNNIIINLGNGGYNVPADGAARYTWRNNILFGNHPPGEPDFPGKSTADPRLKRPGTAGSGFRGLDVYQQRPGSPAAGAGVPILSNGGRDFFGNRVPAGCAPDIGAHQASGRCR